MEPGDTSRRKEVFLVHSMEIPSLLRRSEHQALSRISLDGSIIDLGGDSKSSYRRLIGGTHTFTTVNLDQKAHPDILHDLEKPLPISGAVYDHALLMNVLEHIFEYRQLLQETVRVVKPDGTVVIVLPFLFPVHPSPHDFHRFTAETLQRECEKAGLRDVHVTPLGSGVFAARYVMLDRLLPWPARLLGYYTIRYLVGFLDIAWNWIARITRRKYDSAHYALGYVLTAQV